MRLRLLQAAVGAALGAGIGVGIAIQMRIPSVTGVVIATAAVGALLGFLFRITRAV